MLLFCKYVLVENVLKVYYDNYVCSELMFEEIKKLFVCLFWCYLLINKTHVLYLSNLKVPFCANIMRNSV